MFEEPFNQDLIDQLWRQLGLAAVFHEIHGAGQIIRVGIATNGLTFIDVVFRNGHKDSFFEPFTAVAIEAVDKNAETPV